ncbi:Hsp70 family protein [Rhodococcus sp. G-MC3]|uniref:Hsp70 family protein n=1 Tax=Rhodococcus sp. G-MC3 TaxID=3046209 RepID=UPI0024BB76BB|nr:Hsp70 family protein [Rhodococcus sp. G-MC3]MDJ0392708.1 Hsp70 family protein [Rhodococcus sp. G-MC3]
MRVGIGISTGTEVVCAALVIEEDDGDRTVEYRTVSADSDVNTDIGDLVASAIELMASLAPSPEGQGAHTHLRREPDAIVVAHRTPAHAASIRSACARSNRSVFLVSESDAAHAFLDDSGLVARYDTVAVVDVGATGTTASVIDAHSGAVQVIERTAHFSGDVINRLVKDLVHGRSTAQTNVRDNLRDDRGIGSARYRSVKEHLSSYESAEVGGVQVGAVPGVASVDRAAFDDTVRPYAVSAARFTAGLAASAGTTPESVVLIGGGANIPVVGTIFGDILGIPVISPGEPDTILAKGAAYLAVAGPEGRYPTTGAGADNSGKSIGRLGGAVAGALLVGGIVIAYGIQTLTPSNDSSFEPAGTQAPTVETDAGSEFPSPQGRTEANPIASTSGGTSGEFTNTITSAPPASPAEPDMSTTAAPMSTPTLHPAPNLPVIPWPTVPSVESVPRPALPPNTVPPNTASPAATSPAITSPAFTSPATTTRPGTDGIPALPPTIPSTPDVPESAPGQSTAPPMTTTAGAPTTDVSGTPTTTRVLTPPSTVWTPPADYTSFPPN